MKINLTSEDKLRLQTIKNKIDNDYTITDFTIQQLCRQFKLGDHKLRYGFENLYGMSISEYQTRKRLEHITDLLKNADITISEAVYGAGFSEYSTFYRSFKKTFKITPNRWRKNNLLVVTP